FFCGFSLCNLCVLCVSVVDRSSVKTHHRDTEHTEVAQRRKIKWNKLSIAATCSVSANSKQEKLPNSSTLRKRFAKFQNARSRKFPRSAVALSSISSSSRRRAPERLSKLPRNVCQRMRSTSVFRLRALAKAKSCSTRREISKRWRPIAS